MADSVDRLYQQVIAAKDADPSTSRTARLLRAGRGKMAKKLMKKYDVRASISHQADTRCLVVTFYTDRDTWSDATFD